MIDRRTLFAAAFATAAGSALPRAVRAADSVFRIGYQKNGILVVAKQQGVIEARLKPLGTSVAWTEFSFGPPLLEALNIGGIDFGQTGDAPPIFAQAAGSDLVYAAAQGAAILVAETSPIRTLADLKGKRVAFAKASSAHNLTLAALAKAGLTYADIVPVTLAPADAAAAFASGQVDAWSIWDPYFALAQGRPGVRVLALATDIAKPNNFFLANRTVAQARPEIVKAVVEALSGVAAWCEANRSEVAAILSRGTGVPLAATERAVARTDYVIGPVTPDLVAEHQAIADRFHAVGLIPKPIRVADAVWVAPPNG